MAGEGNTQIIGGKSYVMYSPEWYAARDAQQVHEGTVSGQAAGAAAGAAKRSAYETEFPGYQAPNPTGTAPNPMEAYAVNNARLDALYRVQHGGAPLSGGGSGSGSSSGQGDGMGASAPSANPSAALSALTTAAGHMGDPLQPGATISAPPSVSSSVADDTASRNAIFARTKDTAAKTASGALTGLTEALGSRGLTGGGYEAGQIGTTLAREADTIGEGDRQQAESDLKRADSLADETYQGKIAQRGQDLSAATANANYQTQQAQLQIQQRQTSLAGLEAALNGATKRY